MPKVSVIVPNYNHAPYLKQRIDSILNQTFQDFELILLDDCSTDNSREVLLTYNEHPKVSLVLFNEQNSGTAFKQWNKGIGLAKGEYIWIAESDDWAENEFLEKLIGEIERNPNVGLAYTFTSYISAKGEQLWDISETGKTKLFSGADYIRTKLLINNSICNVSTALFKRNLFDSINHCFYENMKLCGDWFFYVLLCEHTDVLELQQVHSHYRIHDQNVSTTGEKSGKSLLEGIVILDYICNIQPTLSTFSYSFEWARQWIKYQKQYLFSTKTNRTIINSLKKKHKLILLNYYMLNIFYFIKSK